MTATFKQCSKVKSLVFRVILIRLARPVRANVGLKVKKSKTGQQGFKELARKGGKEKGQWWGKDSDYEDVFFSYQYWWEEKNEETVGGGD